MPTLLDVMVQAAGYARRGSQGLAEAGSTQTMLVSSALRNTGIDEAHLSGAWVLRPAAAAGDMQRQCTARPFRRTIGGLTINLPWTVAPSVGEAFYLFSTTPAIEDPSNSVTWKGAVNLGLAKNKFNDTVTAALIAGQTRRFTVPSVGAWVPDAQDVKRVIRRTAGTDYREYDASRRGLSYNKTMDEGVLTIETNWTPGAETVRVELIRPYAALSALTDATTCQLDQAALAARWQWEVLMHHPQTDIDAAFQRWQAVYLNRAPQYSARP